MGTRPALPHPQQRSQCLGTHPCLHSLRFGTGGFHRPSPGVNVPIPSGGDEGDFWSERCDFCSCPHGKILDHTPYSASKDIYSKQSKQMYFVIV